MTHLHHQIHHLYHLQFPQQNTPIAAVDSKTIAPEENDDLPF